MAERRRPGQRTRPSRANSEPTVADPLAVAARTAEIVAARPGWVWPWWLERQVDPASRAWISAGPLGLLPNATGRSWTRIGALDGTATAIVDPRGLVCPANANWSLDWWIGADDRWHLPSREVAVRQHLVDHAPVVETVMRVPGGDVKHRAFVVQVPSAEGGGHVVVVEIENDSAVPCAAAAALRPATTDGIGHVHSVAVDGTTISIDGSPVVHLDRPVARAAVGDRAIDSAAVTVHGDAAAPPVAASCPDGLAQAVAIVPLPHRATMRLVLPVDVHDGPTHGLPSVLPRAINVAAGWTAILDRGTRLVPPPGRLADTIAIARRQLLVFGAAETVGGARYAEPLDRLLIATTLDEFGHHDQAGRVIARWLASLVRGGVISSGARPAQVAAALLALDRHHALAADDALVDASADVVDAGASFLAHAVSPEGTDCAGLVWGAAGLDAATQLLLALARDEDAASDAAEATAAAMARRDAALERTGGRADAIPIDAARVNPDWVNGASQLIAFAAAGLIPPCHPTLEPAFVWMTDIVEKGEDTRSLVSVGPDLGLDLAATFDLATVELLRTADDISARLSAALDAASPTGAWPTFVHPQLKTGCGGDGHDASITARFLRLARRLFVNMNPASADDVVIFPVLPPGWAGQSLESYDLPTPVGRLSFAVRWHGDRPALLWELRPHTRQGGRASGSIYLTAPTLDPHWSSSELQGEALLASTM